MRDKAEHIFVLMLENRSFDHMVGFLPRVGHLADMDGLTGDEFNLLDVQDPASRPFYVRSEAPFALPESLDPDHSLLAVNYQLTGSTWSPSPSNPARNDGFVENFAYVAQEILGRPPYDAEIQLIMDCFGPGQLPVTWELAQRFCLCDRWFSAMPGPTNPNRLFVHAATSYGLAVNEFDRPLPIPTIFQRLEESGYTWRTYFSDLNDLVQFPNLTLTAENNRFFSLFAEDIARSDAAHYTFIQPRYLNGSEAGQVDDSDHAPADVRPGERFIASVYNALRSNPEIWRKSVLIVTFDEHGGFYDHVTPPFGVANPDGRVSREPPFDFRRLGLRVPTIVVSPWLRPQLSSTLYSHSSIAATLKELFGLPRFLTRRDATSNTLIPLFEDATEFRDDTPERLDAGPVVPTLGAAADPHLTRLHSQFLASLAAINPDGYREHMRVVGQLSRHVEAHDFVRDLWRDFFARQSAASGQRS